MDLLDQMRTFVRIVDAGSLSAAARSRRLSLAAVSRQLGALERELGAPLVARSTRRLAVTEPGRRWYAHCARILRDLDDARADVADPRELRGAVTVSASITFGLVHVAPRLERLSRAHAGLEIDLRLEDQAIDLVGEGVDIAIRAGLVPPSSGAIIAHPLARFRRVAAAAPAYLRRRGAPRHPRDLERHDALVQRRPAGDRTRWRFERDGEVVEVTPRARLCSGTPAALRDWALAGAGIALLPEWLVAPEAPRLRRLLEGWATPPIEAWALHRIELRGAPRIRAVLGALATPTPGA